MKKLLLIALLASSSAQAQTLVGILRDASPRSGCAENRYLAMSGGKKQCLYFHLQDSMDYFLLGTYVDKPIAVDGKLGRDEVFYVDAYGEPDPR